jgi:hypothetical protein
VYSTLSPDDGLLEGRSGFSLYPAVTSVNKCALAMTIRFLINFPPAELKSKMLMTSELEKPE